MLNPRPASKLQARRSTKSKFKKPQRQQSSGRKQAPRPGSKQALVLDLLRRDGGATIAEVAHATGWQPHSVRGAISGTLRKKLGLVVDSENSSRGRIYRIRDHA
jgi:transglutaminase/protease-like cytokinesis protein 3